MKKYIFSLCCAVLMFGAVLGTAAAAALGASTQVKQSSTNPTSPNFVGPPAPCSATMKTNCIDTEGKIIGNPGGFGSSDSFDSKIDLYAPFAATNSAGATDLFCKTLRKKTDPSPKINGDAGFKYDPLSSPEDCIKQGGVPVQRLITTFKDGKIDPNQILGGYFRLVFLYALGVGAAAAVGMIVVGGITIILSFDSSDAVSKGKDKITQGAIGIALLILSAALLHVVNPNFFIW